MTPFERFPTNELLKHVRDVRRDRPPETVQAMLNAFQAAFGPEVLRTTHGTALLELMRARGTVSMTYWLEHRSDDGFRSRWFGSIRGGSSLKYVIYQGKDGSWIGGNNRALKTLSTAEAITVIEHQRDELLSALDVVDALDNDPTHNSWNTLQADIEAAAPTYQHLAFFHKTLALWRPDKIDDFHNTRYQSHALRWIGASADPAGIWANAGLFAHARRWLGAQLGSPIHMSTFGHAINHVAGPIFRLWRVGAGPQEDATLEFMLQNNVVAIGWTAIGDLKELVGERTGKNAQHLLRDGILAEWPETAPSAAGRGGAQLQRFLHQVSEDDYVVVARGQQVFGIGQVTGPYQYQPDATYGHQRSVTWLDRTDWKTTSKRGLQTTLYELTDAFGYHDAVVHRLHGTSGRSPAGLGIDPPRGAPLSATAQTVLKQVHRKGQVLLYGPPGTGKTFHAMQAAQELAAQGRHGRSWSGLREAERNALKQPGGAQRIWTCTFHPAYGYEDFVEGLRPRPTDAGLTFEPAAGLFRRICAVATAHPDESVVLVIDEFNRGDVARIFGELLTLLELDKRQRIHVVLPYSGDAFTVPRNVRILATMNTSDRSIALLDAALQRRLGKVELLPDPKVLGSAAVEGISLAGLLTAINRRLLEVLGDRARDLQVGHAYFMIDGKRLNTFSALRDVVQYDLLPLLQDYCADDPRSLHQLVGDALYDPGQRRFRTTPFAEGEGDRLAEALLGWGDEVAAEVPDSSSEDTDDSDDDA